MTEESLQQYKIQVCYSPLGLLKSPREALICKPIQHIYLRGDRLSLYESSPLFWFWFPPLSPSRPPTFSALSYTWRWIVPSHAVPKPCRLPPVRCSFEPHSFSALFSSLLILTLLCSPSHCFPVPWTHLSDLGVDWLDARAAHTGKCSSELHFHLWSAPLAEERHPLMACSGHKSHRSLQCSTPLG